MKFWRLLGYIINKLWLTLAVVVVIAAVLLSAARFALPHLDHFRADIETWVEQNYGQQVRIGGLDAAWSSRGPVLVLEELAVLTEDDVPVNFEIGRTELRVSFWSSLVERAWVFETFVLDDVSIDFFASGSGNLPEQPFIDAIEHLLLRQLEHFQVRNSEVRIHSTDGSTRTILVDNLRWLNRNGKRQATGQLQVPDVTANQLNFIAEINNADLDALSGSLYLEAMRLDISPWLEQLTSTAQIERAEFNVRGWVDFEQGQFISGQAHFDENFLEWRRGDDRHRLSTSPTTWVLEPQENGWLMNSMPIRIDIDGMEWPVDGIRWDYLNRRHRWNFDNIKILDMGPVWSLFGSPGEEVRSWSAGLQPQGTLSAFEVQLTPERELQFYISADDLSWQPHVGIPGVSGLNFEMWSNRNAGRFEVSGEQVSLYSPRTYTDAQQLSELYWQGYWERSASGWTIRMPEARFSLPDAKVVQSFRLDGGGQGSPRLEWSIADSGSAMNAFDALALIPLQLGEDLANYLVDAVQGGEISSLNMIWRGRLADFPYRSGEGIFQARTEIEDLEFKFRPDWPALSANKAVILFENDILQIQSEGAEVAGVAATSLSAEFPDMLTPNRWLHIRAQTEAEAAQVKALFDQSPLANSVGAALEQVTVAGAIAGEFQLDIPLFRDGKLRAFGSARLRNQTLTIAAIQTQLNNVSGTLNFDNANIQFNSENALYRGLPVSFEVTGGLLTPPLAEGSATTATPPGYEVNVAFNGINNSQQVQQAFPSATWLDQVQGELATQGSFVLTLPGEGFTYSANVRSDLTALESSLPLPFGKAPGEIWFWNTEITGDEQRLLLTTGVNEQFRAKAYLPIGEQQFQSVWVGLGNALEPSEPLAVGLELGVALSEFRYAEWRPLLGLQTPESVNTEPTSGLGIPALNKLTFDIESVQLFGQNFTEVKGELAQGNNPEQGWQGEVNAAQTRLTVERATYSDATLITADFLELERFEKEHLTAAEDESSNSEQNTVNRLARLPPFEFVCRICRYDGRDLGRVTLGIDPRLEQDQLRHIRLLRSGTRLELSGGWGTDNNQLSSYLKGQFNSNNISALLQEWGFNSVVRDSSAKVDVDLQWLGAPLDVEVANLNGTVKSELGAGYLRDVSDGGARLFSILSLDSLVRKLTLDFRDIFARGMFFSSFNGNFKLNNGVVSTDNTQMIGSAGDLEVRGTTDLVGQGLNYQLTYTPKVTSSLPILLAWMVNPPSGIAALVIDRMLYDAKVISRLQYQVTGTIDDPVISEVQRDARDVEIPEEELERIQQSVQPPVLPEPEQEPEQEGG
ncbi:YhdP family protein [Aliidiomarina celeris]|uniref:YhdP family protein n=1 Tax=Aliidiomarina celeris TaxID=2249428 RepID=UPI0013002AE1|nr:YhdP family protein [Aliidiomarina celeris]